jgi:secreted trypsin-like serine protease
MEYDMLRVKLIVTFALIASLAFTIPAGAITYGVPDEGGHPHVGALVMEVDGERFLMCSGTLIAPDVFLTVAHCTTFVAAVTGNDRALVTFDDVFDPEGTFYSGTMFTSPDFNFFRGTNDPVDIAVVVFDEPVPIDTPVELPTLGLLNQLNVKNGLKGQTFRNVGYGVHEPVPGPGGIAHDWTATRMVSHSTFRNLQKAWLHLSQNPATSDGGTCFGDSGGPQFLGDTNIIVSITVTGDAICRATNKTYRLDTEVALSFIGQFVDLDE